ncbi:helix-turn-helix domain-containing protein [Synechococcus sp. RedBA-s]|uniref:helix-turn-helix domain-containing protein n=1 Tax=Synechococcus sp. RedBA-s TaxID=2823741 RepID=UPI0020CDF4A2|nr:helix-turn-helix domain-containing protein [Synechococcus sp. RedBA-s]MCP9799635.1 helix-turn-helix domain-containing protein [Synechococcus sp. RedBA-s]
MVASRLSDAQKQELVQRWRAGESSAALADSFGCSPNTVTRVVKLALAPELYEQLKKERGRPVAQLEAPPATAPSPAATQELAAGRIADGVPGPAGEPDLESKSDPAGDLDLEAVNELEVVNELDPAIDDDDGTGPGVLAIDDADDFGEDVDGDDSEGDGSDDGDDTDAEGNVFTMVPVVAGAHFSAAAAGLQERSAVVCQPLESAPLPASLYMLVDKTVELQTRPLSDFPELGALPDDEQARQALVVFANPRQAKRQCGRTQRVIKMPDSQVIQRTATYLVGQGITRLVLEGALYALPGS